MDKTERDVGTNVLSLPGFWIILPQIFIKLNSQDLSTCRQVSKYWRLLIDETKTLTMHQMRQMKSKLVLVDKDDETLAKRDLWNNILNASIQMPIEEMKVFLRFLKDYQVFLKSVDYYSECKNIMTFTPVHYSMKMGNLQMLEFFKKWPISLSSQKRNRTLFHDACSFGTTEVIKSLTSHFDLHSTAINGKHCLHYAVLGNNLAVMPYLLNLAHQEGLDVNAPDAYGMTLWHYACQYAKVEMVDYLVKQASKYSIDLNQTDGVNQWNCLQLASYCGQLANIPYLIINANAIGVDVNAKDQYGDTALHIACIDGQTDTVQLFLDLHDHGIDFNVVNNDGLTPLHLACKMGYVDTVRLLLEQSKKKNIDIRAKNGSTPLHTACFYDQEEVAEMLLDNLDNFGIDINAVNNDGKTAMEL